MKNIWVDVKDIWKPNFIEDLLVRPAVMKRFKISRDQYEACKGEFAPFWVAVEEIKKEIKIELEKRLMSLKEELIRPRMKSALTKYYVGELNLMEFISSTEDPRWIGVKQKSLCDMIFSIKNYKTIKEKIDYLKKISKTTRSANFYAKLLDCDPRHARRYL